MIKDRPNPRWYPDTVMVFCPVCGNENRSNTVAPGFRWHLVEKHFDNKGKICSARYAADKPLWDIDKLERSIDR